MNERLKYCCGLIPQEGKGFADIGTDHGQIPIWLAENGYSGYIYASDIAEGPLTRARSEANDAGVSHKIEFELSDGLDSCPAGKVDCILIAGLGGDNICRILDRCDWIFQGGHLFLFQPMTHAEVLRYWLVHNDFRIIREALISEGEHVYQIFSAVVGKSRSYSDIEYYVGADDVPHEGAPREVLLRVLQNRFENLLTGLSLSRAEYGSSARFLLSVYNELKSLSSKQ